MKDCLKIKRFQKKWIIGDKAIMDIDNRVSSVILWGIPPEPEDEKDKYFGVVTVNDIYDEFENTIFQSGDSFNVHYSEIKKPEEYSPEHIPTRFCWCEPILIYEDLENRNQLWEHREIQ